MWGSWCNLDLRVGGITVEVSCNQERDQVLLVDDLFSFVMEFVNAYLFSSSASLFVAVVTFAFLAVRAWPQKQTDKLSYLSNTEEQASDLSVSKEPEVPEGWWSKRDVFELERRGLFSKVSSFS
jgi:hypothetical protein